MSKFRQYDKYEIYEDGRIFSYWTKKFLKPGLNTQGYQKVTLVDNEGNKKTYRLNRVVYEAVSGSPIPEGMQVNHIDEDKTNDCFRNLNLMSPKDNTNYGTGISRRTKTRSKQVGAFKNDELVMVFQSTQEAGRQGFCASAVSACCRNCFHREGNNMYKGFLWKYL